MTSLSTRFLGHPRLTNPTFKGFDSKAGDSGASVIVEFSTGMYTFNCNNPKTSPS